MFRVLALILALLIPAGAFAKPIPIKVVVLTTFETGASSAKTSGEFQAWAARSKLSTNTSCLKESSSESGFRSVTF